MGFFVCLFIVQTGLSDPGPVHSPHFGVWWKEIPQPFDSKVEPSFGLYFGTHHALHSVGDEGYTYYTVHRQDPHTHPPGMGKELKEPTICTERKIRHLNYSRICRDFCTIVVNV